MKRILLALAVALYIAVLPASLPAHAEASSYARASAKDAYFFTQKDESTSVFIVPYTYCIEVLRDEGDWYYASYARDTGVYKAVTGYCRKSDFTPLESMPEVTYLYKTVTVTFRSDGGGGSLPVLDEISLEAAFYGNFYSGATAYSYVYAHGSFGYIKGATEDFPLNATDADKPQEQETPTDGEAPAGGINFALVTALAICALAAAALVMLYVTTKKKNRSDG